MGEAAEYECEGGHYQTAPHDKKMGQCLAYVRGTRCPHRLKAVGKGSKKKNEDNGLA